jgi:hypothetical protein
MQPAFTSGELSPALGARVDLAKYASGLKVGLNVFLHPEGGSSNRAGLEFIAEVKDSTKLARLIPFEYSPEQTYIIEAGDGYFRWFREGGPLLSAGVPYEIVTPYADEDLREISFAQEKDVMYLAHVGYDMRKLSRLAETNWTITTPTFGPKNAAPTGLVAAAQYSFAASDRTDMTFKVTAVNASGDESAPSAAVTITNFYYEVPAGRYYRMEWDAMAGAVLYRIYRTDSGNAFVAETPNTYIETAAYQFDSTRPIPAGADPGAPATPTGVTIESGFGIDIKYKVAAVDENTGEESLPSTEATVRNDLSYKGNKNLLSWAAVAGASYYLVYKNDNGTYGYIGKTENTTFIDENIAADIADGPQTSRNPFTGAGNSPRTLSFYEQRLVAAGSANNPDVVEMSQSGGLYENFGKSAFGKATDALTFRVRSKMSNEIRAMVPLRKLLLMTSASEWLVSGGSNDFLTPENIVYDAQGYRGSARLQPIVVGNTMIFLEASGQVVRDFSYEFSSDSFDGKDLTVLSKHLFEATDIVAWAYAKSPHSIIWCVLSDGKAASLTYLKEHDVWGWTRHETDGVFEDVAVVHEDRDDVPYFIVKRTIDGVQRRYIERMHDRRFTDVKDAFFVDSGLSYSGAAVSTFGGLDHLEGRTVVALADGNVVRDLTVVDGEVTLPFAASVVHIGLPYTAEMETLELDLGEVRGLGTVQGRTKTVPKVDIRVRNSRGMFIGPRGGIMDEWKQRSNEAWDNPIALFTGDIEQQLDPMWSKGGNVVVRQVDPLPMTVLAIMPEVVLGA